jgi:dTDP-4-dehydrorhamnose 3,5-epimerase
MSKFKIIETPIKDLLIIETKIFKDDRGFFIESYNLRDFEEIGLDLKFVQDNISKSKKGVLRGLHFQLKHPQRKLVRVISGRVYDVAVDLRVNSPTFGRWFGIELTREDGLAFYIPGGFAHGFLTLEDNTYFFYKCTEFYYPDDDLGVIWNDPEINVSWPLEGIRELIISDKDKRLPSFREVKGLIGREETWRKL